MKNDIEKQIQEQPLQNQKSSKPGSKDRGVLGSKYLASEEEHQQFANSYGSELVITMNNSNPLKK